MRERDRGRNKEERKNNSALCTTWSLATLHWQEHQDFALVHAETQYKTQSVWKKTNDAMRKTKQKLRSGRNLFCRLIFA